jgi:hypothetical protein
MQCGTFATNRYHYFWLCSYHCFMTLLEQSSLDQQRCSTSQGNFGIVNDAGWLISGVALSSLLCRSMKLLPTSCAAALDQKRNRRDIVSNSSPPRRQLTNSPTKRRVHWRSR